MKAARATSEQIDALTLAFGRLLALREERDAHVAELDTLAAFSCMISADDYWWWQESESDVAAAARV